MICILEEKLQKMNKKQEKVEYENQVLAIEKNELQSQIDKLIEVR